MDIEPWVLMPGRATHDVLSRRTHNTILDESSIGTVGLVTAWRILELESQVETHDPEWVRKQTIENYKMGLKWLGLDPQESLDKTRHDFETFQEALKEGRIIRPSSETKRLNFEAEKVMMHSSERLRV